ncbi:MAG: lycopene cyclase domain-containing protein [Gracilimonas sp.]|uniref:lycopene cyclase domain-containing protein n=1 Tax=Gracilimonas sp. TaxID=1974203 RepID=UPI003751DA71|nr:lycopene cyclase domain-containing protein [Gracilimonas sp.]
MQKKTGFDIESLIFSFAIGGIGAVLYKMITPVVTIGIPIEDRGHKRHRFHLLSLFAPPVVFLILALFTPLNHIYYGSIAMFIGGISAMICRPDLIRKIWISGLLFTGLYFIYFTSLNMVFPDYVEHVWTLEKLSGLVIVRIPLEEYLFTFTFGMY